MRLKIECVLDNNIIFTDYRRKILSFFKKSLQVYCEEIKEKYYDSFHEKNMTFSCYLPIEKIEDDKFYLKGTTFKIFIGFDSIIDGIHFYNAFVTAKKKNLKFKFDENNFKIKNINKLPEKEIKEDIAIFKTLSPIVIREQIEKEGEKKEWFHLLDEKGIEILKKNMCYSLREKFTLGELEALEIKPIEVRKTVVNFYKIKFPATNGKLVIKGDKKILNYLYRAGISSKCPSGFGMLELL